MDSKDRKVVSAINSIKPVKKDVGDQLEKALKEIATNTSIKKYLGKIILWIINIIKSNPKVQQDNIIQKDILEQLKSLNENIQNLNNNISDLINNGKRNDQ